MALQVWRLDLGAAPAWREREEFAERFGARPLLWVGEVRQAVHWPWSPAHVCVALRGRVRAVTRNLDLELANHDVLVGEAGVSVRLEAIGEQEALVAMLWLPRGMGDANEVLPACYRGDLELGLAISRLAHQAVSLSDRAADTAFTEALRLLIEREERLGAGIPQCPGRSPRHRRQLFIRLLRARNLVDHGPPAALDLAALAAVASLSPSHFLRLFHRVFGLSPHRYLVRQRMQEARRLVEETTRPIGSIAAGLGFINRCAFARLFKQHFGTPATRLRRQALMQTRRRLSRPVVLTMLPNALRGDLVGR
jgi:AraC family transcriptional regulator